MIAVLRSEWTKFRTVRGWPIAMAVAALLTAGIGLWAGHGPNNGCGQLVTPNGSVGPPVACHPRVPIGPGGEAVTDSFYFVHPPYGSRSISPDGSSSISVRVTSLTGFYSGGGGIGSSADPEAGMNRGVQPWSKAGIIVKASTRAGSAYAAMMVTGGHGVRMQYDYTHDVAGLAGAVSAASPRWLRLVRSGDTVTGYDSADGTRWTRVGSAVLPGLPATARVGLFAASPQYVTAETAGPSVATAVFDHVSALGLYSGEQIGGGTHYNTVPGGFHQANGVVTVTGSGDIAPAGPGPMNIGISADHALVGAFAGLIVAIVVGTMFMTAEYRRGLIRTTLAASPRRGQVLAAKAIVIGSVTFVAGFAGAAPLIPLGGQLLRGDGNYVFPMGLLTELRVVAGTAALLAVAAVFALALGAILRHGAGPVTAVIALVIVPFFFAGPLAVLPAGAADWLLRITPAAGFAIQQAIPGYAQVSNSYTPQFGYYPLAPWAGLAVACLWALAALGLALVRLRRRDA